MGLIFISLVSSTLRTVFVKLVYSPTRFVDGNSDGTVLAKTVAQNRFSNPVSSYCTTKRTQCVPICGVAIACRCIYESHIFELQLGTHKVLR